MCCGGASRRATSTRDPTQTSFRSFYPFFPSISETDLLGSAAIIAPQGLLQLRREEGVRRGLYRGLSLNYLKTLPNVMLYMSLYDQFKVSF